MSEEGEITSENESNCEPDHLSDVAYSKGSTSVGVVGSSIGPSSFTPSRPNFSSSFFRPHHQVPLPPLPIISGHVYHPPPFVQFPTGYPPNLEYPFHQQVAAQQQYFQSHHHQNQPFMARQQLPMSHTVNPAVPKKLKKLKKRGTGVKA